MREGCKPGPAERSGFDINRRPLLAAIIAGGVAVGISFTAASVSAQNYSAQAFPTQGTAPIMRPVPRTGHVTGSVSGQATTSSPTRQGWSLKWRRSTNVAADPIEDRQNAARNVVPTSGTLPVAADQPQLQAVAPAAYLNTPQRAESLLDSAGGSVNAVRRSSAARISDSARNDYSSDPFGDDRLTANQRIAQNAQLEPAATVTLVQTGEMLFPAPQSSAINASGINASGINGESSVPALDPSASGARANDLRDSLNTLDSTGDLFDLPAPEPSASPAERPNPSLKKMDDGPSLGDLLKDTEPDELPEPRSPSNKDVDDEDFENPFGLGKDRDSDRDTDNDLRSKDRRDRDRLNLDGPDREDDRDENRFDEEEDEDLKKTQGLSCNDFRSRIQRQTIDQVSLDISPPYRPDEIDQSRYDKLKAKFDEKQAVRQWRNLSGVPMTTGRLRDIAYENVVVETEYGSSESIPIDQLSEADLAYLSENWGLPQECRLEQVAFVERSWTPMTMTYMASNLCHNPLYFEDVNLERYGHTHGPVLEPIVQTAHFFGNIAVLPYKMGVHCPTECQYALGYYRPGNCAPWIKPPVPLSVKGGIAQAAAVTGLFWLIP